MGHEAPNSRASTGVDPGLVGHELPQNGLRVGVGPLLEENKAISVGPLLQRFKFRKVQIMNGFWVLP